ncbi:conserved unknown protein [Ectocarpus siliculosus]|uniref:Uncharacterized protein n=1 Tax=Ectocarpus siliculosus TaxID=2880 RepID=D7FU43_ECTSI|nr:conserved unknown protein [Ectocarpus siliculosus]|eukprot:CBJ31570.1 conserved unknown protein [Ectocarpus siliculosus]
MGAMCSKSGGNVANKENMGQLPDEMMLPNGVDSTMAGSGGSVDAQSNSRDRGLEASKGATASSNGQVEDDGAAVLGAALDSTAFLSPAPAHGAQVAAAEGTSPAGSNDVEPGAAAVVNGIAGQDKVVSDMQLEDRSAWVARNLGMLPRGGSEIEAEKLKELPGLEDCLHELLSERARHLSTMETLSSQLRRREAEATKAAHDNKALTARLECSEQDRSALERRGRAEGEEHRVERARWFVHKQELETRCVQLESRDTQYRASIRKKEVEYGRLQDSLRRAVEKGSGVVSRGAGKGGSKCSRGIESNLELSPGAATTEAGKHPLGAVLNNQAESKVGELEGENFALRNMLQDLQREVMELKDYQDRHGDLVSAERGSIEGGGIWGGRMSVDPLAEEVIEGMPADWLERQFGEENARQMKGMRCAVKRVLGEGEQEGGSADDSMSAEDVTSLVSQLREARSLLREQDAIMFAAIFDKPGAGTSAANKDRCMFGGDDGVYLGGSGAWDSLERLEQQREELGKERLKLEADKAKFLEEAVHRDSKSFVFACPPATPTADSRYATPVHHHGKALGNGKLTVAAASPAPNGRGGEAGNLSRMSFTPPTASPDTTKLLGALGIVP